MMHEKREQALSRQGPSIWQMKKNVYKSTARTASISLSRFMLVENRIMGVVRRQDEDLTVNQLLLIGEIA